MEDALAELARAPVWAQIGLAFFAVMFLTMVLEPVVGKRRYRRRFDALVRELGLDPSKERDWPFKTAITVEGRSFEIRYDFGGGRGYRGPRGHLLIASTPLAESKWSLHQVDIEKGDSSLSWLGAGKRSTGDAAFDARFAVISEGVDVRDGWLDAPTRASVAQFFDHVPVDGPIRVHEGHLRYTMSSPWRGIDAAAMRALLQGQAALASALERTARGRW